MTRRQALQQLAEGCGPAFAGAATPELRALLLRGLHHPNRFVREAGYHTLAALCAAAPPGSLGAWGAEAAALLQDGLSENWSQVWGSGIDFKLSPIAHPYRAPAGRPKRDWSQVCLQTWFLNSAVAMFCHILFAGDCLASGGDNHRENPSKWPTGAQSLYKR